MPAAVPHGFGGGAPASPPVPLEPLVPLVPLVPLAPPLVPLAPLLAPLDDVAPPVLGAPGSPLVDAPDGAGSVASPAVPAPGATLLHATAPREPRTQTRERTLRCIAVKSFSCNRCARAPGGDALPQPA